MNQPNCEYDVFISYSSKDRDWVQTELLPRLEKNGLRACIDYRDFELGELAIRNMERAVEDSRKTVFLLSSNYTASAASTLGVRVEANNVKLTK